MRGFLHSPKINSKNSLPAVLSPVSIAKVGIFNPNVGDGLSDSGEISCAVSSLTPENTRQIIESLYSHHLGRSSETAKAHRG
eukprot:TRINITY_DN16667_c0_g1_i1.p1 TRINITY_DN16667_c0_g1~~TRINITY_DN16667_c0_g1_i1.p1  ORF type:complete len:82 (+),score=6.08 TRINITY_DN16667_c0_g1_i1:312-557(+)